MSTQTSTAAERTTRRLGLLLALLAVLSAGLFIPFAGGILVALALWATAFRGDRQIGLRLVMAGAAVQVVVLLGWLGLQ